MSTNPQLSRKLCNNLDIPIDSRDSLTREDLDFLTDEQYAMVLLHLDRYGIYPSSYIIYYYLGEPAIVAPGEEAEPVAIPDSLKFCARRMLDLLPVGIFCYNICDLTYFAEIEMLPGGVECYSSLLCMLDSSIAKMKFFPEGTTYIVSRELLVRFSMVTALREIDVAFRHAPEQASSMPLSKLVRMRRDMELFWEIAPVLEEYISIYYNPAPDVMPDDEAGSDEDLHVIPAQAYRTYKNAVKQIYVSSISGETAPHKPIMLLTLIDMIRSGAVIANEFYFDNTFLEAFETTWVKFNNRTVFKCNPASPFTSLVMDGFWHLHLRSDCKKVPDNISGIRRDVIYGYLDQTLYDLLQVKRIANKLRYYIINHFALNKEW